MGISLNLTVDASSRKILSTLIDRKSDGTSEAVLEPAKLSDLGENTSFLEYGKWMNRVFTRYPSLSLTICGIYFSIAAAVGYFIWWQYETYDYAVPIAAVAFMFSYWTLTKLTVRKTFFIRTTQQSDVTGHKGTIFMTEDEIWISDYAALPPECKYADRGNKNKLIAWIDARNPDEVVAYDPWKPPQHDDEDEITSSDVMGTRAYLIATYERARDSRSDNFMEKNLPGLSLMILGFIAVYFASTKIQAIMGVQV